MENFRFADEDCNQFCSQLEDALRYELSFMQLIASGEAKRRPDQIDQYCNAISAVCGVVSNVFPMAQYVGIVTTAIKQWRDYDMKGKANEFIQTIDDTDYERNCERFRILAREMAYRFGTLIKHTVKSTERGPNPMKKIAKLMAMRVFCCALEHGLGFDNVEPLFVGVVEGYKGFYGKDLRTTLNNTSLSTKVLSGGAKQTFTIEGMFARSAFIKPLDKNASYEYWIHADPDRQVAKPAGQDYGYVKFLKVKEVKGKKPTKDDLIPKYGYIALPTVNELNTVYKYGKYSPDKNEGNYHVVNVKEFGARYVSWFHIESYLKAMRDVKASSGKRLPFNRWLQNSYPNQYCGKTLMAIYRDGKFDQKVLDRKKLSFSDGDFSHVDFSYCTFDNVTLGNMSKSLLMHCLFRYCTATGDALNEATLNFSRLENCTFQGLTGIFRCRFGKMTDCDFAGSHFLDFGGEGADEATKASMKTVTTMKGGQEINVADQYREREALLQRNLDEANAKSAMREAQSKKESDERLEKQAQMYEARMRAMSGVSATSASRSRNSSVASAVDADTDGEEDDQIDANGHLKAFSQETMDASIKELSGKLSLEDKLANKMFEALFFNTPIAFLNELTRKKLPLTWLSLVRTFRHSTSGEDGTKGKDGLPGEHGLFGGGSTSNGRNGGNPTPGGHGSNATENVISLLVVPGQNFFLATPEHVEIPTMLPLYDAQVSVNLYARGGAGGAGGAGGSGGNGARGRDGEDATRYQNGTNGSDGGDGGDGANGGNGGNAGNSSNIIVYVKEQDMELLWLIDAADCGEPQGGEGGAYGLGGNGGDGGNGGASYSWSESVYAGNDSNGNAMYRTIYHTNPGGRGGNGGRAGVQGRAGLRGNNGVPGKFIMKVVATKGGSVLEYAQRFCPSLVGFNPLQTETGIIEPGQWLRIFDMQIHNEWQMPTPQKGIKLCVRNNKHFDLGPEAKTPLTQVIYKGETVLTKPETYLDFKTARVSAPNPNDIIDIHTNVEVRAEMTRIGKQFKGFQKDERKVRIQYPVELSVTRGAHCILADDQIPLTIKVRNVSLKAVGVAADTARKCYVHISIPGADFNDLCPVYRTGADPSTHVDYALGFNNRITFEIRYIPAGGEISIQGTIALKRSDGTLMAPRLYEHMPILYSLSLGDIDRPLYEGSVATIQQELHHIQLAEQRQALTSDDILLVCNSSTTKEEIEHWHNIVKPLGKTLVIWNISVYQGFTYGYNNFNLLETFKNGTVIFLNTPFNRDDNSNWMDEKSLFMPLRYLNPGEIFEAARRRGIRTYVINAQQSEKHSHEKILPAWAQPLMEIPKGKNDADNDFTEYNSDTANSFINRKSIYKHLNVMEKTLRDEHLPTAYQHVTIKKVQCCGPPTERAMDAKREGLKKRIRELNPNHDYYFKQTFEPTLKSGCLFKLYVCGEVEVRRGLDTTYAMVASRDSPLYSNHTSTADSFTLVKLLPFKEKLQLFASYGSVLYSNAILSDLVDEQNVFCKHIKELGNIKKEKLAGALSAWSAFTGFDHSDLVNRSSAALEMVKSLCVKMRFFVSLYRGKAKGILHEVVKEGCLKMLARYSPGYTVIDLRSARKSYASQTFGIEDKAESHYERVFKAFVDPYNSLEQGVTWNHWAIQEEKVLVNVYQPNVPQTSTLIKEKPYKYKNEGERSAAMQGFVDCVRYRKEPTLQYLPNSEGKVLLNEASEKKAEEVLVMGQPVIDGELFDPNALNPFLPSAPIDAANNDDGDNGDYFEPEDFVPMSPTSSATSGDSLPPSIVTTPRADRTKSTNSVKFTSAAAAAGGGGASSSDPSSGKTDGSSETTHSPFVIVDEKGDEFPEKDNLNDVTNPMRA